MYRKELPLMFPDNNDIKELSEAMIDPFEFLMDLHKKAIKNKLSKYFRECSTMHPVISEFKI